MVLVESFLAGGVRSRKGGTPTEVLLDVTEDELENGGGFIENVGCVGVSAETSRRLACDAAVVEVACDAAGRALHTGRRTRSVRAGMRRALNRIAWIAIHSAVDEGSREDHVARISEQHGARKKWRGYRAQGTVPVSA